MGRHAGAPRHGRSSVLALCLALSTLLSAAGPPATAKSTSTAGSTTTVNLVRNPSAATDLTGWTASGDAGPISMRRVAVTAPDGTGTGISITRSGGTGTWAYALASLRAPDTSFVVGRTYRLQAWVRDRRASGGPASLLIANGNYGHRPSEATVSGAYRDSDWHLLTRTFTCRSRASSDTALYLGLPTSGPISWDVTSATIIPVVVPLPSSVSGLATQMLTFEGAAGTAPDAHDWSYDTGGAWGVNELETYTTSTRNVSVDGQGHLDITVRREPVTGADGILRQYTSGRVRTDGKFVVPPGSYVEAPIKAPTGEGVWPAFWLMGANHPQVGWPASGEIDVFEGLGASPQTAYRAIHTSSSTDVSTDAQFGWDQDGGRADLGQPVDEAYRLYGVYFDRDVVRFYVDHREVMTYWAADAAANGRTWPFDQDQFVLLDVAVGLGDPSVTEFPRTMQVGAVAAWLGGVPF